MADRNYDIIVDLKNGQQVIDQLKEMTKVLIGLDVAAERAQKSLLEVGKATAAMTRTDTKAKKLATDLDAVAAAAKGAGEALKNVNGNLDGVGRASSSASDGLGRFLTAGLLISQVSKIAKAVGDEYERVRDGVISAAEGNLKFYDSLRELRGLLKENSTQETAPTVMAMMAKTGLNQGEAVAFMEQFEGSIPAAEQKGNIRPGGNRDATPQQISDFKQEIAETAANVGMKYGIAPKTAGDLAGVMGMYAPINSKEDVAGQMKATTYALNEGRGKVSRLLASQVGQAGNLIGNGMTDLPELAAFMSVASTVSKSESTAGAEVGRMNRALNRPVGEEGETLRRLGIDKIQGDREKLRALAPFITGEGGNAWLAKNGFGEAGDRRALVGMAQNMGVLDQRIDNARAQSGMGAQEIADTAKFMASDKSIQARQAANSVTISQYIKGLTAEDLQVQRGFAEGKLANPNQPGGARLDTFGTGLADKFWNAATFATSWLDPDVTDSRQQRIDQEVADRLIKSGGLAGIDVNAKYPGIGSGDPYGPATLADAVRELVPLIQARNIDPFGGATKEQTDTLKLILGELRKKNGGMGGNPGGNAGGAVLPRK